jgi:flavin-binding protein dodecin
VGSSEKGWMEAAKAALDEAKKTIKDITGLEVIDITVSVDPNTNTIKEYKVGAKIAFGVEHGAPLIFISTVFTSLQNNYHSSISQEVESITRLKMEELTFLADTERESSLKREAIHTYEKISKKGYSEQGIANLLEVLHTMIQEKKGGQNGGNSLIAQLRNDLTTYGSLSVAIVSLMYQNSELAFSILRSKKTLQYYQAKQ